MHNFINKNQLTAARYAATDESSMNGGLMGGDTLGNPSVQPYKYGAKELDRQNGLDWYDSQARHYAPVLGRTPTMDPKAEDDAPISSYAWCSGNPVRNIDPDGKLDSKRETYLPIWQHFSSTLF